MRYIGISWSTFDLMVEQLKMYIPAKGRPSKLSLKDQILLCSSYRREYRNIVPCRNKLRSVRAHCFKYRTSIYRTA